MQADREAARAGGSDRGSAFSVLYDKIGRILKHLLNVPTPAMDVGALTLSLRGLEDRDKR